MDTGVISSRYARAIYEYAEEKGMEALIYKEMSVLANNFQKLPRLRKTLINPMISIDSKISILITACGIEIADVLGKAIEIIVKSGRAEYMENIALKYEEVYRKAKGIVIVNLTTAEAIDKDVEKALLGIIPKEESEKTFEFNSVIDPSIIGGFILEIKDRLMDAGVRTQLNQLRLDLTE
ncbi:MAG: F0F1 ATP synthase subunit delta [Dysgonamonadaceae bacterium]|jgi:F-type H+-transporting ATPase subunit delta|nr:F0F1 ATP synthase subunit delta [Dysgonamonadaceae bacterium]